MKVIVDNKIPFIKEAIEKMRSLSVHAPDATGNYWQAAK